MTDPWDFRWLIPGVLAGAPRPRGGELDAVLSKLRAASIGAVVNVHELPLIMPAGANLVCMHEPTRDFHAVKHLDVISNFVDLARATGVGSVTVCLAGRGRTGQVLAAYLIWSQRITAVAAIAEVKRRYNPNAVEVQEQCEALAAFAKQLGI